MPLYCLSGMPPLAPAEDGPIPPSRLRRRRVMGVASVPACTMRERLRGRGGWRGTCPPLRHRHWWPSGPVRAGTKAPAWQPRARRAHFRLLRRQAVVLCACPSWPDRRCALACFGARSSNRRCNQPTTGPCTCAWVSSAWLVELVPGEATAWRRKHQPNHHAL